MKTSFKLYWNGSWKAKFRGHEPVRLCLYGTLRYFPKVNPDNQYRVTITANPRGAYEVYWDNNGIWDIQSGGESMPVTSFQFDACFGKRWHIVEAVDLTIEAV